MRACVRRACAPACVRVGGVGVAVAVGVLRACCVRAACVQSHACDGRVACVWRVPVACVRWVGRECVWARWGGDGVVALRHWGLVLCGE